MVRYNLKLFLFEKIWIPVYVMALVMLMSFFAEQKSFTMYYNLDPSHAVEMDPREMERLFHYGYFRRVIIECNRQGIETPILDSVAESRMQYRHELSLRYNYRTTLVPHMAGSNYFLSLDIDINEETCAIEEMNSLFDLLPPIKDLEIPERIFVK